MTLIEAKSLSLRRGSAIVLDNVDLELARGELVIVLGPNGAGKSTLARLLLGLEKPDAGQVSRIPGLNIGYVPQAIRRDPTLPLSTRGFLRLGRGSNASQEKELLESLGVDKLLDRPVAQLSGGELRRAALGRALSRSPDLLVLDEPLAGVDAASQEPIAEIIAERAHRDGAGVLLISHEVLTVIRLADRILCLDHKVLACGTPNEIVASAVFADLFGPLIASAAQALLADRPRPPIALAAHG